jgi:hypothetical protein
MVIRRVGVLSLARLYAAIAAAVGLLAGVVVAAASLLGSALSSSGEDTLPFAGFGVLAIVALPILYGVLGFVGGAIGGALYNLFAGIVGGLEIDVS